MFDAFEDEVDVFADVLVFEADDGEAGALEVFRSLVIIFAAIRPEMRSPIEFDHQPGFRTIKVDNVRTNATLSTKLFAEEFSVLEVGP